MSLVQISGNVSGTGTLTIAAPNTNSNRTLTLPDATTTFVGTDATQTLTNKTITGANSVLVSSATGSLGYSTGAGGTVTQATSKSTAVTLDTPSGRITMNNAALAASTTVEFTFNNSLITGGSVLVLNITGNVTTAAAYNLGTRSQAGGSIIIGVRNVTAGSLSEAMQISYVLISGATT